jgi:hypothetical protein
MDPEEIGWEGLYWINLAPDREKWLAVVNTDIDIWVL